MGRARRDEQLRGGAGGESPAGVGGALRAAGRISDSHLGGASDDAVEPESAAGGVRARDQDADEPGGPDDDDLGAQTTRNSLGGNWCHREHVERLSQEKLTP